MANEENGQNGQHEENVTPPLSVDEMEKVIAASFLTPIRGNPLDGNCVWGAPINIEGEPGISKTSLIESVGASMGLQVESLFAGRHPPEDFAGSLIPDGNGGAKQICALGQVRSLIQRTEGVIFLDEINCAALATMGALQSFINERHIGDERIPGGVRIISAANPEDLATGGHSFTPAVANRLIHIEWGGPSVDEWISWNMNQDVQKPTTFIQNLEDKIKKAWSVEFAKTRGLFNGFLKANASLLHKRPPIESPNSSKGWPSHRTWDHAERVWTTNIILDHPEPVRYVMLQGGVGTGAADSVMEYFSKSDLPDPREVLAGKWSPNTDRLDITLAAYSSMATFVVSLRDPGERDAAAIDAWGVMQKLIDANLGDVLVPLIHTLGNAKLGRKSENNQVRSAAGPILVNMEKKFKIAKYMEEAAL